MQQKIKKLNQFQLYDFKLKSGEMLGGYYFMNDGKIIIKTHDAHSNDPKTAPFCIDDIAEIKEHNHLSNCFFGKAWGHFNEYKECKNCPVVCQEGCHWDKYAIEEYKNYGIEEEALPTQQKLIFD